MVARTPILTNTSHPHDMVHTYLESFEKIQQCVFELVHKIKATDRRGGGGRFNISRPGPSALREIIRLYRNIH